MEQQEGYNILPIPESVNNDNSDPDPEVNVDEGTGTVTEEEVRIHDVIPKEQLIKILECPVCLEIPFPPILTCERGHIVCSSCLPRLSECGICRGHFRDARNYPLEEIILGSTFPCKYMDQGCNDVILGRTFLNHLQICKYNPDNRWLVLCNENGGTPCKNALIPSNQYLEHLKSQHDCNTGGQRNQSTYSFLQWDDSTHMGQRINTDYFAQNGKAFLQKWEFEDNFYYTWICMLNSTQKSRESVEVNISVFLQISENKMKFSSTMLGVHDATLSLEDIKASGQFLALHPRQLLAIGGTGIAMGNEAGGRTWDVHWNSQVQICQKTASTDTNDDDVDDDFDWS